MANKQEVELLIKATDQNSKATFDAVAKSVDSISQSLERQVAAAEKGEVSVADLTATMKALQTAAADLLKQQNLVNLYENLAAKLDLASEKAATQRVKLDELRAATAGNAEVTSKQTAALERQETAVTKADAAVERARMNLAKQSDVLDRIGIDTTKLEQANNGLARSMTQVGAALGVTNGVLDGYQQKLDALSAARADEAEAIRASTAAAELRQRVNDMRYIDVLTEALEREEAALRSVAEAQRNSAALADFQSQADRALAASRGLESFTSAGRDAAEATSNLRQQLAGITSPTAVAIQNINGLEARIAELSKTVGDADQPFKNYQEASLGLSVAQQALLKQAGLVDSFRAQQAALDEAAVSYQRAQNEVHQIAAEMKAATAPSDELTLKLKQAESAANSAANALQREHDRLEVLSGSLKRASIDVNDLAAAEMRLKTSAELAANAQRKIGDAGVKAGKDGPFGLSPYALTNLGYQLNDVFTQILSGTSIMQTAAQQGGQILQIFPGVFAAIAGLLPVILPLVVVFGGLFMAIKRVADLKGEVKDFQMAMDASADGALYNAKNLGEVSRQLQEIGIKAKDAHAALKVFMAEGLAPDQLLRFGRAARDLAEITGKTIPAAAAVLAEGFTKGYEQIAKLDDELNFLTLAERQHIKAMFDSGDAAGGRARAFQDFYDKNEAAAAKARGPWTTAWITLKSAIGQFLDGIADGIGGDKVVLFFDYLAEKITALTTQLQEANSQSQTMARNARNLYEGMKGDDFNQLVKTVMMEGGPNATSQTAVAQVIARRATLSGESIRNVIDKPGQFEARNNKGDRAKMDAIDVNSEAFAQAAIRVGNALKGDRYSPNITGNAVNFYSPAGNAARGADGRPQVPAWAQGKTPVATIAGQQYFEGTFPGMRPPAKPAGQVTNAPLADTVEQAAARAKITRDELSAQQAIWDAQNKQTDEIRLQNAELQERRRIQNAGGDDKSEDGKKAVALARQIEQKKIDEEHDAQRKSLLAALTQAETANAQAQERSLKSRLDAISDKFKALKDAADKAGREGLREVAPGLSVDKYKEALAVQEKIAKNNESLKFFEEQLNSLTSRRTEVLRTIQAQQDIGAITQQEAMQRMTDTNARFAPMIKQVAQDGEKFAMSLRTAIPDPKLEALITKLSSASALSDADFFNLGSKSIGTEIDRLQAELKTRLDAIKEDVQNGAITPAEAVTKAQEAVDMIAPKVASLANDAERFAKAFGALNNAATGAFVAKAQAAAATDISKGPKSPVGEVASVSEAVATGRLNALLEQRNAIVALNQELVDRNRKTIGEAEEDNRAAYEQTNDGIQKEIATLTQLNETLHETGQRGDAAYGMVKDKLELLQVQSKYTSSEMMQLKETIVSSFTSGAVTAINDAVEALGRFIIGTERGRDALRDIGRAALSFAASFLRDIQQIITRMLALRLIKALMKMGGGGDGEDTDKGATKLLVASAAWAIVAAQLQAAADTLMVAASVQAAASLFHGGGVVGQGGGGQSRAGVSPLAWIGAPRYHSGAVLGLRPDEQAAILQDGEEVLSKHNPRNIRNGGASRTTSEGGGGRPLKQVLAIGEGQIAEAMKGGYGEDVVLTHISANRETIRQKLGIG